MHRDFQLIKGDWRLIGRDPMLLISMVAPIIILIIARIGFPVISKITTEMVNFPLESYFSIGSLFLLSVIPMMFGMVYGFILLDERDSGIISYIVVTPLGKQGYLFLRMILPFVLSVFMCFVFLGLTGFDELLSIPEIFILSLIISLEAPMIMLFLGAFAGNKVEGIALSKGIGIIMVPMLIDYFLSGIWRWLMAISPLWWIERWVFSTYDIRWLYIAGALIIHLFFLGYLYKKFGNRMG